MRRHAAILLAVVVLAAACTSAGSTPSSATTDSIGLAAARVPRQPASPAEAATAATAVDAFGLDLYRSLGSKDGNSVISPASIALALAMARAGAAGDTASQMDAVLHFRGDWAAGMNSLDQAVASRDGTFKDADGHDMTVALRIANAPFAQRRVPWQQPFLDTLAAKFGAGLRLVDFVANPEAARKLINGWVSDRTEHKIPELLAPGVIDGATRLALVNAIYLKAPWATPFSEAVPAPFHRANASDVQAPTMALTHELGYAEGAGWRAVELPYVGDSLALDIVVPDDLASFESGLTAERFASIVGALAPQSVALHLPKFSIRTQADLVGPLTSLGMPLAFDANKADFSAMTTQEKLFVAAVVHQATIEVDEKGTEASAATAVMMAAAGVLQSVDLRVDRPFLFVLRDIPTGLILFLGRVVDPTAGS